MLFDLLCLVFTSIVSQYLEIRLKNVVFPLQLDLQPTQPVAFFAVEDGLRKHRELFL